MGEIRERFNIRREFSADRSADIDMLLDTGATYSLVPRSVLESIGIAPHSTVDVILADGTKMRREVGDAHFEYHGERGSAPVIFGEVGEEPLLGALTLEALRLVLHPFRRELYPAGAVRL